MALLDFLGVETLDGFHQRRGHRLRHIEPLALRNRNRARIGAHGDCYRNADAIETGHVAEPCNPHPRRGRAKARQGFRGRDYTMGALAKFLRYSRLSNGVGDTKTIEGHPFLSMGG